MIKPWKTIGSKLLGNFRIFTVRSDRKVSPRTAAEHDLFVIDCANWVNVVAVTPMRMLAAEVVAVLVAMVIVPMLMIRGNLLTRSRNRPKLW